MIQKVERSSVDSFVRVAHQLVIEVTWEVSHKGHGDTYHG